jgi:hypothetical protein
MNIIIGKDAADKLKTNYTVLELETFNNPSGTTTTAYCVVNDVALSELSNLEANKQLHSNFVREYNNKNYKFCEDAVEHLLGKFNGELDSFYIEIIKRIKAQ